MIYLQLFYEFFKTGLFAVGGGLATLPFLYDMADRTGWFTRPQLADMLAVSESTPGPIGVNMATYVGFVTRGIPGAIISTLGLVTPSVIVILIIAAFLKAFRHNRYVEAAFYGLRPASTAMVAAAGLSVVAITLLNTGAAGLAVVNWKALALAAVILGFVISAVLGKYLVPALRRWKAGQAIKEDGPTWHMAIQGTPTMRGLMIIAAGAIVVLVLNGPAILSGDLTSVFVLLFALVFGLIGFIDDYAKIKKKENTGLSASQKFLLQLAAAIVFTVLLRNSG